MTKTFFDRKAFAAGAILTVVLVSSTEVYAGGLFGDGGLFRGTVGNWLDKHVEEPITTPIAQGVGQVVGQAMAATSGLHINTTLSEDSDESTNKNDEEHKEDKDEHKPDATSETEQWQWLLDPHPFFDPSSVDLTPPGPTFELNYGAPPSGIDEPLPAQPLAPTDYPQNDAPTYREMNSNTDPVPPTEPVPVMPVD